MAYNPKDHYFKLAKKEGFLARSAYKLDEIQKKWKLIRPNAKVLDLGCSPGSWSQIVLKILGETGVLRGIDLKPVDAKAQELRAKNAFFMVGDIFATPAVDFVEAPYDVILSDMAPNTTGNAFTDQARSEQLCLKVVELSDGLLKPGGHLVMKLFMGGGAKEVETAVKKRFATHHMFRPKGVRKESFEIYLVGIKKTV
jgi:23S rRNA (uridine2552-2'-O)-methyltransferase